MSDIQLSSASSPYSESKAIYHIDRINDLRAGKQIVPAHLLLIVSDFCTQSCRWCSYRWEGNGPNQLFHIIDPSTGEKNHNPKRMLSREKVIEILDDCAEMGVKCVEFTGGGEPTAHPHHAEFFKHALDRGLEVALVSHGVLLKPHAIETLMRATWIRISVDCAKPETYASMRRVQPGQYGRAIENIEAICRRRDETGSSLLVGMGFVLSKENWREVADAASIAKSLGVNSFRISAVFQPDNEAYYNGFYDDARELCESAESLSDGRFQVSNLFGRRIEDLVQGHPDYKACHYMQFATYIGGDANVYRCCNTSYNQQGLIGSIASRRFKELWLSEEKQADFRRFNPRTCDRCQFNGRNKAIDAAVSAPEFVAPNGNMPQHVNYI